MPTIAIAENTAEQQPYQPGPHEIETFSGRYVDLKDPQPNTIILEDIAHGLANTCRYNGQIKFYSVAEHAVKVSLRLERLGFARDKVFKGLHHDDSEAFLGDVTRPLKSLLQPIYGDLSDLMDAAIITALGLSWRGDALHDSDVKDADNYLLALEAYDLLPSRGAGWGGLVNAWDLNATIDMVNADIDGLTPELWTPDEAEGAWLSRHWELVS